MEIREKCQINIFWWFVIVWDHENNIMLATFSDAQRNKVIYFLKSSPLLTIEEIN